MAHHVGTVSKSSRLPNLPFHAQCSCGTAGTFPEAEQALQYLRNHGLNVKAAGPQNSFELVDNSDKPEVIPGRPGTHIPGVGNMPATHAALGTEPPPISTSQPAQPVTDETDYSKPENWKKNRKKNK
jgi:hypothetical protein